MRLSIKLLFLFAIIIAVFTLPAGASVDVEYAQTETGDAEIEFTGVITAITDSTIVVNGLSVQTDQAEIEVELVLGATVKVEGVLQPNAIIIAREIEDPDDDVPAPELTPEITPEATPELTPEATPEATAEPDDDDNVVIVIRGPVQEINVNIITIYDIDIMVNADDPILNVINIGDELEIEGVFDGDDDIFDDDDDDDGDDVNINIVIIAVNITFVDVDVYINDDGQAWRDPGNCQNGPPPWAPAHGWRRRCENPGGRGGGRSGSGSSSGSGS